MSVSDGVFLSALQPNSSNASTYAVPTDTQLTHSGTYSDETARAKRVHQQVSLRLAERSTQSRRIKSTSSTAAAAAAASPATTSTSAQYATYNSSQYPTSGVSPST